MLARSAPELDAAVATIGGSGGVAIPAVCDVTDEDDVTSAVERVVAEIGRLDAATFEVAQRPRQCARCRWQPKGEARSWRLSA